jgi:hypothetical protein
MLLRREPRSGSQVLFVPADTVFANHAVHLELPARTVSTGRFLRCGNFVTNGILLS